MCVTAGYDDIIGFTVLASVLVEMGSSFFQAGVAPFSCVDMGLNDFQWEFVAFSGGFPQSIFRLTNQKISACWRQPASAVV